VRPSGATTTQEPSGILPAKSGGTMLHNNDAEMSEILSIYPHFIDLTAPFHSLEFEGRLHKVGQSLYAKGGIDLVR
jgi:hypothetical protein